MWRAGAVFAASWLFVAATASAQTAPESFVDLELVLAVDVSGSIDEDEAALQRAGYVKALADPRIAEAIKSGFLGRIAVTYVEWAGPAHQAQLLDWRVLDGAESAQTFAAYLAAMPVRTAQYTSISTIIDYASYLIENNAYQGTRRVIDISGDGPNNTGLLVTLARDKALAQGLTINGLPILNGRPNRYGFPQLRDLDRYYVECVIGGPGAFIEIANGFEAFADTVLRKLLLEIAALPAPRAALRPAAGEAAYDCLIGERQLRRFLDDSGGLY
ncbi:MAG: DUF1194 domain-containing protein [Alphaproteobacteria bacterium]